MVVGIEGKVIGRSLIADIGSYCCKVFSKVFVGFGWPDIFLGNWKYPDFELVVKFRLVVVGLVFVGFPHNLPLLRKNRVWDKSRWDDLPCKTHKH